MSAANMTDENRLTDHEAYKAERLAPIRAANRREREMTWEQRSALIHRQFPSINSIEWTEVFDDEAERVLAPLLWDILRFDANMGRTTAGPRPGLDYETAVRRFNQLLGRDYALSPFPEAMAALTQTRSIRSIAAKTGLSKTKVGRFLRGDEDPTADDMRAVARAYGKHPSYFLEWRTAFLVQAVARRLNSAPEATVSFYRQMLRGE